MSGFFGCISGRDCVADVFYGTDYHSHLGTKRAGMAFCDGQNFMRSIHSLENAYFRNKFEDDLPRFAGSHMGIGVISDTESQPITLTSHLGRFSLVTVARIDNIAELTQELLDRRVNFAELSGGEINATELVGILISTAGSFREGIELVQQKIKGSCSMMILTESGIYASRDKLGRTPVVIGRDADGFAIATETSAFANLGYTFYTELGPGQTCLVTSDGLTEVTPALKRKQICAFLWVYYGYPSSYFEGVNVEEARYRNGCLLGERDTETTDIDLVAGIPDSGIGHAIGYSNCKQRPYKRAFVKYTPTWPRSFMPSNQELRSLVAKMKLIPNEALIRDASMVLLDDSIVRGTQLKDNIVKLVETGSRAVHIRVASPPLIYPCVFINFSASRSKFDLITRRIIARLEECDEVSDAVLAEYADPDSPCHAALVEAMRTTIGADTLQFQRLEDLVTAIGLPKEQLCTHCWDNSSYF
ncbi:MAG: amidophosphoribosyltransferase [Rikenellaceae bacterium]|nr:amidophosphoribosyltransferase [Rikenellaceae bacterium]MCL2693410.1 amidophosphoribosyltransferase [Rikenellaceae bacterium]